MGTPAALAGSRYSLDQAAQLTRSALQALRQGDDLLAEQLLREALKRDPRLASAWLWLGTLQTGARRAICLRWARLSQPDAELPSLDQLLRRAYGRARPQRLRRLAAGGLLALTLLALLRFEQAYQDRVYPGVSLFGQQLSGRTLDEASVTLRPLAEQWARTPLLLRAGDAQWSVPLGALGRFDAQAMAAQAFDQGREGAPLAELLAKGRGLLEEQSLTPTRDDQAASLLVAELSQLVERPSRPARFVETPQGWRVLPEAWGRTLDREAARLAISQAWSQHSWGSAPTSLVIELAVRDVPPAVTASQISPLLSQLRQQTAAPLALRWAGGSQALPRAGLLDLLRLPAAGQAFPPDHGAIRALLQSLARQINRPASPSRLVRDGDRVREFQLARQGLELDLLRSEAAIVDALRYGLPGAELALRVTQPPPGEAEQLGLTAVLGEGHSQFASYSSPDRDQNVLVGGYEFDGLLVPPGGLISAGETIDSITWEKGYRWGDMISGGIVVPSLGGGICQVATTFYRAAFWSGLEIVERHNHIWRLPWYEEDAPPGMDATIALGGPDLKVRNNTGRYLLIKVSTDLERKQQHFTIYGAPQQWRVEMSAGWQNGAAMIERRVTQGEQIVLEDQFASYYW